MVGIDGREEVALTVGDSIDMMPAWSPLGQMFFVSDRSGAENLWAIDLAPAMLAAQGGNPFEDGRTTVAAPMSPAAQPEPGETPRPGIRWPNAEGEIIVNVPVVPDDN